jgi:hypothetical protein
MSLHLNYKRKRKERYKGVPWNCRHAMSSGAADTTLPSLGSSRDHRDSNESLALSAMVSSDIEQRGINLWSTCVFQTAPHKKWPGRRLPFRSHSSHEANFVRYHVRVCVLNYWEECSGSTLNKVRVYHSDSISNHY